MKRKPPEFKTEAELCAAVIAKFRGWEWTVYPESCGFDFLAVRDGFQLGVEAKLRPNLRVLAQAMDRITRSVRLPHCVGVLVERATPDFEFVSNRLGLVPLSWWTHFKPDRGGHGPYPDVGLSVGARRLSALSGREIGNLRLPEFVIDVPAGVPSPQTVSAWKISAVKMAMRLRSGEHITRSVLEAEDLSYSTFWGAGWIDRANPGERPARYRLGSKPNRPLPDVEYPEIVAAIQSESVP